MRHVDLPRTDAREPVAARDHVYHLRGSEARILATVGTFRSVAAHDLESVRSPRDGWRGDLQSLSDQGLIQRTAVVINRQPSTVVTLTREGRELLDARRSAAEPADARPRQAYYADLVKPRELAHDAQLYRLFQAEAAKIEARGGRIERVVLDYEFKREYQRFINRPGRSRATKGADRSSARPDSASPGRADRAGQPDRANRLDASVDTADMHAFAEAWDLPIVDGHLELPDVRIEYETPDGQLEHRDVELITENYSRSQMSGKARAGFALYRAAGAGGARTGGTPHDPHHLDSLR
jgi:hypothetical protein